MPTSPSRPRPDRAALPSEQAGVALIVSLFFAILTAGIVASGSIMMEASNRSSRLHFKVHSQAKQFARSGLTEALSWFRRQTIQPVTGFAPIVDEDADPPILDTIDENIGIVREFPITGNFWGRYEIWRDAIRESDPKLAAWRETLKVIDVSDHEDGSEWRLRSIGYVFERREASDGQSIPFSEQRIIASQALETQILRLRIKPPGQAAVSISRASNLQLRSRGYIIGGNTAAGVFFPERTGNVGNGGGFISGTPTTFSDEHYDASTLSTFGVTFDQLKSVADTMIDTDADFPSPVPLNRLVVSEAASTVFTTTRPLSGYGVVYVRGNVVIGVNSNSNFTGFLYVDGDLTVNAPAQIFGAVVCTGTIRMEGIADFATITYDDDALNALRVEVGKYRMATTMRPIYSNQE